eukprot:2792668-Amphidinium_carterae.1
MRPKELHFFHAFWLAHGLRLVTRLSLRNENKISADEVPRSMTHDERARLRPMLNIKVMGTL